MRRKNNKETPQRELLEAEFQKHQGYLLKKARKKSSFTQEQVGAAFGLSQDTISKIEKGDYAVNSYRLMQFAKLYNKPVSFFYMVNTSELNKIK